jgi:hypothetical protein
MREFRYICFISGVAELTPELSYSVFEAVDAEIELNLRDGICYLECVRMANSLEEAVTTTLGELEQADLGIRVVRVETEDSGVVDRINSQLLSAVQTCYART